MHFNPELIRSYSPDDETYKRAEKIADLHKWSVAASTDNLIWGEISGSASEAYSTMICIEPLLMCCNCPVKAQTCKHSLALLILFARNELSNQTVPDKIQRWVNNNISSVESKLPNEDDSKSFNKDKRSFERLELMRSGIEDLERWLYDVMAQGLANVAFSNQLFWENAAARFKDSKLSRISYGIREIADELSSKTINYNIIAQKIGEIALLVQVFKNIEKLEFEQQEELLNQIGRLLRKNDVIESGKKLNDIWQVCGKSEHYNLDGLLERKVWLQGKKSGTSALLLDYLFQGDFDIKFNVGDTFESDLYFYPSIFYQRALLNSNEIKLVASAYDFKVFNNFESYLSSFAKKVKVNPWFSIDQAFVENLRPTILQDKVLLYDEKLSYLPIVKLSDKRLYKLLSISGGQPMTLSIAYSITGVEVLAYVQDNSIYAL